MSRPGAPAAVRIMEVGPRDGLQNEPGVVPTAVKLGFIQRLAEAGFADIECTSFVSPKAVPQLADAAEVASGLRSRPGLRYSALVPNEKGLERALASGIRAVSVFTAASESFTRHNIRMSIEESFQAFAPVAARARAEGLWFRGYVSTAFGCPYEGAVDPGRVVAVAGRLLELGAAEVSIGDTIGVAAPAQVRELVGRLLRAIPAERLALHFHDTRGTALANVMAGIELGIPTFDSSAGGLGGCPYAPGAGGNLATEDLIYLLEGQGLSTGVSLDGVIAASRYLEAALGRSLPGKVLRAGGRAVPKGSG